MQKNNETTFLSTLSLRRATRCCAISCMTDGYFYPRSPCGERRASPQPCVSVPYFYPRSPCGERQLLCYSATTSANFYPRSPCGERPDSLPCNQLLYYFYPRSPCGERPMPETRGCVCSIFLSTLSLRRATWVLRKVPILGIFLSTLSLRRATLQGLSYFLNSFISIHALLAESDSGIRSRTAEMANFYPRSPCGERQQHFENLPI